MPRAFLKTKNRGGTHTYKCTKCGKPILAGESYYTWKFNRGARYHQHAEHGHPRRSQLSNSKMAEVYDAVDDFDITGAESPDDILSSLSSVAEAARSVAQEYQESADNIMASWPAGNPTSEACSETASELESWADSLDGWTPDYSEWDESVFDTKEEWLDDCRESAEALLGDQPDYQG